MPTFYNRFRRNLPNKFPEWLCACVLLGIGVVWLLAPETFRRPEMASFTEIMQPKHWTLLYLGVSVVRLLSISFNGEFPILGGVMRVLGAIVGCGIYGACVGRSLEGSTWQSVSVGIILYGAFFVTDIRNAIRSTADTFNAWRKVTHVVPVVR